MHYNWKCCSFYPNNFGASALLMEVELVVIIMLMDIAMMRIREYLLEMMRLMLLSGYLIYMLMENQS